jgi:ABC-type transport system involved in cytochrome c biogenesis permease subunit
LEIESWAVVAAAAALLLAAACSLPAILVPARRVLLARAALSGSLLAALLAAGILSSRADDADATLLQGRYETLLLALLGAAACASWFLLAPARRTRDDEGNGRTALLAALPAAAVGVVMALLAREADAHPLYPPPAVRSFLAALHYGFRGLGVGLLLAGGAAAAARVLDPRPSGAGSDAAWDRLLRGSVVLGLPPYLVSVLVGAVWHGDVWAAPWKWDLVETWPFAVVLIHLAWLHLRFAGAPGSRGSALLLAAGGALAGGLFLLHGLPTALQSTEVYADF